GYDDWEAQRPAPVPADPQPRTARPAASDTPRTAPASQPAAGAAEKPRKNRLAPWEAEELAGLPDQIAALEAEQANLAARLSDPDLYRDGTDEAQRVQQAL